MRLVHWVSSGIFSRHCIILVITFLVSEGRSVGLRPRPIKAIRFQADSVSAFRCIFVKRHDIKNLKQVDVYVYICFILLQLRSY